MKNYIGPPQKKLTNRMIKAMDKKKTLAELKKELQVVFNRFIRLRDTVVSNGKFFFVCISCGQPKDISQMNAGHYWPVGGHEAVRYDEDNCHGQCIACNMHKHGNEKGYRARLIKKIGQKAFDILEIRAHNRSKLMPFEIEVMIKHYSDKIEDLWK